MSHPKVEAESGRGAPSGSGELDPAGGCASVRAGVDAGGVIPTQSGCGVPSSPNHGGCDFSEADELLWHRPDPVASTRSELVAWNLRVDRYFQRKVIRG